MTAQNAETRTVTVTLTDFERQLIDTGLAEYERQCTLVGFVTAIQALRERLSGFQLGGGTYPKTSEQYGTWRFARFQESKRACSRHKNRPAVGKTVRVSPTGHGSSRTAYYWACEECWNKVDWKSNTPSQFDGRGDA